ncbi:MAG: hypothetical protein GY866_29155 [Proteobacteria bacterium]|nr:hypothetical protein [Pseudomonadota bacterium]
MKAETRKRIIHLRDGAALTVMSAGACLPVVHCREIKHRKWDGFLSELADVHCIVTDLAASGSPAKTHRLEYLRFKLVNLGDYSFSDDVDDQVIALLLKTERIGESPDTTDANRQERSTGLTTEIRRDVDLLERSNYEAYASWAWSTLFCCAVAVFWGCCALRKFWKAVFPAGRGTVKLSLEARNQEL